MGIKMDKVRHNGQELKIEEYDTNKKYSQLKCFYCDADVIYVTKYNRDLGDRTITVNPFFRLKGGSKHKEGCQYTIDGVMVDIVARCADAELMTRCADKFRVRLLLVTDDGEEKTDTSHNGENEKGQYRRKLNYISQGKKAAYLSSMKRIMKLKAMVENNSELNNKVELQFLDRHGNVIDIPWNRFYYDTFAEKGYEKLLRYLRGRQVYHPICVDGFIKEIKKLKEHYILKLGPIKLAFDTVFINQIHGDLKILVTM